MCKNLISQPCFILVQQHVLHFKSIVMSQRRLGEFAQPVDEHVSLSLSGSQTVTCPTCDTWIPPLVVYARWPQISTENPNMWNQWKFCYRDRLFTAQWALIRKFKKKSLIIDLWQRFSILVLTTALHISHLSMLLLNAYSQCDEVNRDLGGANLWSSEHPDSNDQEIHRNE